VDALVVLQRRRSIKLHSLTNMISDRGRTLGRELHLLDLECRRQQHHSLQLGEVCGFSLALAIHRGGSNWQVLDTNDIEPLAWRGLLPASTSP
jgi:hypothetical protein